jgi:hypothetical protein
MLAITIFALPFRLIAIDKGMSHALPRQFMTHLFTTTD